MNTICHRLYLLIIFVLLITACNGGSDQGTADVIRNLQKTNLDSSHFPWTRGLADDRTKRWDIKRDGLIPVKFNGSALAREAVDEMGAVLHMSIFDKDSIDNLPDDRIDRGIIISEGTAIGPNGVITRYTCGHVSAAPETTDYPKDFYDANGRINTKLYVNLSSRKCAASLEIAIHEFGHALGLGDHFPGFGSGDAISPPFWQALYTLYNNDVGTFRDDLDIRLFDP